MNDRNLFERTKRVANVQRFYESKLRAQTFDCQQNQGPVGSRWRAFAGSAVLEQAEQELRETDA
jgi:hypothetical protein